MTNTVFFFTFVLPPAPFVYFGVDRTSRRASRTFETTSTQTTTVPGSWSTRRTTCPNTSGRTSSSTCGLLGNTASATSRRWGRRADARTWRCAHVHTCVHTRMFRFVSCLGDVPPCGFDLPQTERRATRSALLWRNTSGQHPRETSRCVG